jgi:hypothetical protein
LFPYGLESIVESSLDFAAHSPCLSLFVSTTVHSDGTSILSLHNIPLQGKEPHVNVAYSGAGTSFYVVDCDSAFSDDGVLNDSKLLAYHTLKFSSLTLMVRAIRTLPYLNSTSGPPF